MHCQEIRKNVIHKCIQVSSPAFHRNTPKVVKPSLAFQCHDYNEVMGIQRPLELLNGQKQQVWYVRADSTTRVSTVHLHTHHLPHFHEKRLQLVHLLCPVKNLVTSFCLLLAQSTRDQAWHTNKRQQEIFLLEYISITQLCGRNIVQKPFKDFFLFLFCRTFLFSRFIVSQN